MPKVSVLMPVYNGQKYLHQAMESILTQTFGDFEFLIIDDGSKDDSLKIIQSYQDTRIKLHQNEQNLGLVATLNRGLKLAQGEYIARMDCDDISDKDRLAKQVDFLKQFPQISLVGSSVQVIDAEDNLGIILNMPTSDALIKWSLQFYCPIMHPTVMFRKQQILELNGYSSEIILGREKYSGEDYDLWRRLSNVSSLGNLPEILLHLRKHQSNTTKIYFDEHIKNSMMICQAVIADILEQEINADLVKLIFTRDFSNHQNCFAACDLIYNSYQKFLNNYSLKYSLSNADQRAIKHDCARQILSISRHNLRDFRCLGFIFLSAYLDPKWILLKLYDQKFYAKVFNRIRVKVKANLKST